MWATPSFSFSFSACVVSQSQFFSFSMFAAREAFSSPKGALQLQLLYFSFTVLNFYGLRLRSQPPALLQSLCLFLFSFSASPMQSKGQAKKPVGYPRKAGCVCGTPVCQGFNDSFVYLYAGGAGSSDTARVNEALCQMDRETCLQVSSWVLEAQLDWP